MHTCVRSKRQNGRWEARVVPEATRCQTGARREIHGPYKSSHTGAQGPIFRFQQVRVAEWGNGG